MGGGVEIRRCVSVLNMLRYKIINSGFKVCSKQTCNAKTCTPPPHERIFPSATENDKPYRKKKSFRKVRGLMRLNLEIGVNNYKSLH